MAALTTYMRSDAMREHLFKVERGLVQSSYVDMYHNTINRVGAIRALGEIGLGPFSNCYTEVRTTTITMHCSRVPFIDSRHSLDTYFQFQKSYTAAVIYLGYPKIAMTLQPTDALLDYTEV